MHSTEYTDGTGDLVPKPWKVDMPISRNYVISANDSGTVVATSDTSMTMTAYEEYLQFAGNGSASADTVQTTRTFIAQSGQTAMDSVYWYGNHTSASADSAGFSLVVRNKNGTTHSIILSDSMRAPGTANTWVRRAVPLSSYFTEGTRYSVIATAKMTASQRVNVSPFYFNAADPILASFTLTRPDTALGPDIMTNGNFSSWLGTAFPDDRPTGFSAYNAGDSLNYRENATNAMRIVTGTAKLIGIYRNILTIGKSYRSSLDIVSGTGKLGLYAGNEYETFTNPTGTISSVRRASATGAEILGGIYVATNIVVTNYDVREYWLTDTSQFDRHASPYKTPAWRTVGSVSCMDFGYTQSVSSGTNYIGTTDLTLDTWCLVDSLGNGGEGHIVSNGKFIVKVGSGNKISITSDSTTWAASADSAFVIGRPFHLWFERKATGEGTFYINNVLSGTANQSTGTPTITGAGTVYIGNAAAGDRGFNGALSNFRVYSSIPAGSYRASRYTNYATSFGL